MSGSTRVGKTLFEIVINFEFGITDGKYLQICEPGQERKQEPASCRL